MGRSPESVRKGLAGQLGSAVTPKYRVRRGWAPESGCHRRVINGEAMVRDIGIFYG